MSQKPDDLEAVRSIVSALTPFDDIEKERIIRWASEKLGLKNLSPNASPVMQPLPTNPAIPAGISGTKDIKAFVTEKNPTSENQLVAVVAYYYKFEAPSPERKNGVTKDDILEACRKANWKRPKFPNQILVNASAYGLVDKIGTGTYEINAVGENLVAVSMPGPGRSNSGNNKTKTASKAKSTTKKKK